jgi:hypothetical protein
MSLSIVPIYKCYFCKESMDLKNDFYYCNVEGLSPNLCVCTDCCANNEIDNNFIFLLDTTRNARGNLEAGEDNTKNTSGWRDASKYYTVLYFTMNLEMYSKIETELKDRLSDLQTNKKNIIERSSGKKRTYTEFLESSLKKAQSDLTEVYDNSGGLDQMNKDFLECDENSQMEIIQNIIQTDITFDLTYVFAVTKYKDVIQYVMDNHSDLLDKDDLKDYIDDSAGNAPLLNLKKKCYKKLSLSTD